MTAIATPQATGQFDEKRKLRVLLADVDPRELATHLAHLTEPERRLLDLLLSDDPIWVPQPGPQTAAYVSLADELFYGGAAGGGKTDLLLGLGGTAHRHSIVFRREYPQLKGILERAHEIFDGRGEFNASDLVWKKLPGRRRIEFGAVQLDDDKRKYQGRPHDAKLFDELPNFLESQYRFLIGWTRTTIPGQRTRVVGAGNPPTDADGEWVIRYWAPWLDGQHANPARPGELRWFAVVGGHDREVPDATPFVFEGTLIQPKSRTFIPAKLADNAFLKDSGYAAVLQGMPEPLRSQMLFGDFSIGVADSPWQVIPTEWIRAAQERWKTRATPPTAPDAVGVDVARGGADKTVLARRHRNWFAPLEKHPGTTTPDGPAVVRLALAAVERGGHVNVDSIGVGASVYDGLRQLTPHVSPINFAEGSSGTDKSGRLTFANLRAESYWRMREALDPAGGEDLALPPDPELLADLCAPRWSLRAAGVQIESKEDIHKRIGRSPDCGDAAVLALIAPAPVQYAASIYS